MKKKTIILLLGAAIGIYAYTRFMKPNKAVASLPKNNSGPLPGVSTILPQAQGANTAPATDIIPENQVPAGYVAPTIKTGAGWDTPISGGSAPAASVESVSKTGAGWDTPLSGGSAPAVSVESVLKTGAGWDTPLSAKV